jgi:serine/threonine protein kinase
LWWKLAQLQIDLDPLCLTMDGIYHFPNPLLKRSSIRKINLALPDGRISERTVIYNETTMNTYEVGRLLKKAIFGKVIHALELRNNGNDQYVRTGKEFAIKVYSKQTLRGLQGKTQEDPFREISALQFIGDDHPNLMGQVDCCSDEASIYSIMRFCPGNAFCNFISFRVFIFSCCFNHLFQVVSFSTTSTRMAL